MKKVFAILVAALMLVSLIACNAKNPEIESAIDDIESKVEDVIDSVAEDVAPEVEDAIDSVAEDVESEAEDVIAGLANPITEYASIDEINELTGGKLIHPPVMGITDERYSVIDGDTKIGQYNFTANGVDYACRFCSDIANDVCGIYEDGKTLFEGLTEDAVAEFEGGKAARFFAPEGQYVVVAADNGALTAEQFEGIVNEIKTLVLPVAITADEFTGDWHEVIAGRAILAAAADGSTVTFHIEWPASAFERYFWDITGVKGEDGTVTYENGVKRSISFETDENGTETVLSEAETGSFVLNADGNIEWTDNSSEGSEPAVFAKN